MSSRTYELRYTPQVIKQLKKLDKAKRTLIIGWIEKHLHQCSDPRMKGSALKANLAGAWRYRIGEYRLLAEINDQEVTLLLLHVAHRKEVYKEH